MNSDIINLFSIPGIEVTVDTFWFFNHCMKNNYFNAQIMIRMIAIDCYYNKNDYGWKWYNEMQIKRVNDNPLIPKHMAYHEDEFKKLIQSFEKNGFLKDYPIVINKDFLFIDGAHRLALALYFGIKRIPITIDKDFYNLETKDYSFDWFEKHEMKYVKEKALEKYSEICKMNGGE